MDGHPGAARRWTGSRLQAHSSSWGHLPGLMRYGSAPGVRTGSTGVCAPRSSGPRPGSVVSATGCCASRRTSGRTPRAASGSTGSPRTSVPFGSTPAAGELPDGNGQPAPPPAPAEHPRARATGCPSASAATSGSEQRSMRPPAAAAGRPRRSAQADGLASPRPLQGHRAGVGDGAPRVLRGRLGPGADPPAPRHRRGASGAGPCLLAGVALAARLCSPRSTALVTLRRRYGPRRMSPA